MLLLLAQVSSFSSGMPRQTELCWQLSVVSIPRSPSHCSNTAVDRSLQHLPPLIRLCIGGAMCRGIETLRFFVCCGSPVCDGIPSSV